MRALTEWESKLRLGPSLPTPTETLASTRAEAVAFATKLPGPVVLKASGVMHKTEAGLVRKSVASNRLGDVFDELAQAGDGRVLVAEQVDAELELIVGGYRDPNFGPVVVIGVGGTAVEVLDQKVGLLAPAEDGEVERALGRWRGQRLLTGIRGKPPTNLTALAGVIESVSDLLVSDPSVVEIDCNPVLIRDGEPLVADALVVIS